MNINKKKTVAISGGFDPIHIGHVRMMQEARALGDRLVVILNNDNWLKAKKGFAFMPEQERAEIIAAFPFVDDVVITGHEENGDYNDPIWRSVCRELELIKPDIFANGGDRKNIDDIPEGAVCKKYNIDMTFDIGVGGKVQSSSWLTNAITKKYIGVYHEDRPWGSFDILGQEDGWWAKRITVNPGARLSLQQHYERSELWMCVKGEAICERGTLVDGNPVETERRTLFPGDTFTVNKYDLHRLSSKTGCEIIEVAWGAPQEHDNVRHSDDYHRESPRQAIHS